MSRHHHEKSARSSSASNPPSASPAPDAGILANAPGPLMLGDAAEEQFATFVAGLLDRIEPADHLGRMLAELVIQAAGRLRKAAGLEPEDALPDMAWCRFQALAERNLRAAAKDLQRHLDQLAEAAPASGPAAPATSSKKAGAAPPDPAQAPEPEPARPESTAEEIAEAAADWRRHIALVKSVSTEWPILLRTRREADSVAAWLADGRTEEEILSWYLDLTRADVAACRSCDAEGLCGPFDPELDGGYPPGLPVLDDLPDDLRPR